MLSILKGTYIIIIFAFVTENDKVSLTTDISSNYMYLVWFINNNYNSGSFSV